MTGLEVLFDVVVALVLVVVAVQSLHAPNLFTGIAFFISFGLVMALAWVRLEAPDVALAEAAVGAGLTGVLLLDAARERKERTRRTASRRLVGAIAVPVLALVGALVAAVLTVPRRAEGLGVAVARALPDVGVEHGVTGVLLAFRALDTWLEVAVLLLAVAVVLGLQHAQHVRVLPRDSEPSPVLAALLRVLTPVTIVFAGFLLWAGTTGPGGAFQAGVLLGAALILLELAGVSTVSRAGPLALRALLAFGFASFALAGGVLLALEGPALAVPSGASRPLIVALEIAIATSVAVSVVTLMVAANLRLRSAEGRR
jgi:uncharacterized MnhB-related membrane protein